MSEQLDDLFGEIFQRYFRPAIDAYPRMGGALVERLLTLTDDIPDRLAQTRCVATAWAKAETPTGAPCRFRGRVVSFGAVARSRAP